MLKEHIYLFINLEWFLKLKSGGHSPCDLNLHRLKVFKQWMLNRQFRKHETSQLSLVCCRHPTSSCIATTDNILTAAALTGNVIRRTRPTTWESILALGISPLKIRDFFFQWFSHFNFAIPKGVRCDVLTGCVFGKHVFWSTYQLYELMLYVLEHVCQT